MLNLTQHPASQDQIKAGVIDLTGDALASLKNDLTFGELPDEQEIRERAERIAELARDSHDQAAMIGGALWLMAPLAAALWSKGIRPVFAYSVRETEEQPQADGSIRKIAVFRHAGFVPAIL